VSSAGFSRPEDVKNELAATLWKAADKLRGAMPASTRPVPGQYKDVVPGLVFLGYIADDPGVFAVPPTARWKHLADKATNGDVGQLVDAALDDVLTANPAVADALPRLYRSVDTRRLRELVRLLDDARLGGEGGRHARGLIGGGDALLAPASCEFGAVPDRDCAERDPTAAIDALCAGSSPSVQTHRAGVDCPVPPHAAPRRASSPGRG